MRGRRSEIGTTSCSEAMRRRTERRLVATRVNALRHGMGMWREATSNRKMATQGPWSKEAGRKMNKLRTIRLNVDSLSSQVVSVMQNNKQYAVSLPGTPEAYYDEKAAVDRASRLAHKEETGTLNDNDRQFLQQERIKATLLYDAKVAVETMREWASCIQRYY